MSDTLNTEGQQTTAADPQQTAGATTEGQQAAADTQAGTQQQATEGQTTEGQQATDGNTEGQQAKPEGAPEKYEFKPAEGFDFDPRTLTAFSEVAKDLNLPQESAQKILDKIAPAMAEKQRAQIEEIRTEWEDSARADKEFGGDKLEESLASAKKALDAFGTPELRTLLNDSGLGNHPDVIRFMVRAGKAISEDRIVTGGNGQTAQQTTAQRMYPNMNP